MWDHKSNTQEYIKYIKNRKNKKKELKTLYQLLYKSVWILLF